MTHRMGVCAALPLLAFACASVVEEDEGEFGPASAESVDDGKADGANELRVRASGMTMWIDKAIDVRDDGGELVATIKGRTSRTITGAFPWVPDDAFGTGRVVGPRSFEIELRGGHEINTIASGMPLLVSLEIATGTVAQFDARLQLGASLGAFTGSSAMWIGTNLRPVYLGPELGEGHFRATVSSSQPISVQDAGSPLVSPTGTNQWSVDWRYGDVEEALRTGRKVTFQNAAGAQKRASMLLRTRAIGLTSESPESVWPTPTCELATYNCMRETQGVDLAACGDYYELQRCIQPDLCELTGNAAPLEIYPLDLSYAFASGAEAFVEGCDEGGAWCTLAGITSFMHLDCLAETPTMAQIVDDVLAMIPESPRFVDGIVLDRAGVMATPMFGPSFSVGADEMFAAIDTFMASGPLVGWHASAEIPCHNCTEFVDTVVLWYPEAARIVVVRGTHGYD